MSQLCRRCGDLCLQSSQCQFADSQADLDSRSKSENCGLCNLLSYSIQGRPSSPHDTFLFTRVESHLAIGDGNERPILNLYRAPGQSSSHFLVFLGGLIEGLRNIGPSVDYLRNIQTGFSKLPEAGSKTHFKVLRKWIHDCDTNHECVPTSLDFVPTRLLEVSEFESDVVRLLEDNDGPDRHKKYLALSHRWGSPEYHKGFRTLEANIKRFKSGFKASHLPKTFCDAILITRGLGLNDLWIDSLCIIQDDTEDWNMQSQLMEQVFKSTYCTLAASCAAGSNDGFLNARSQRRCIPMMAGDETYYACENIEDFSTHVDQSELNQRGWVLQERTLSRRTVYFT